MGPDDLSSLDLAHTPMALMGGEELLIVYANLEFRALLGKAQGELVGIPFAEFVPDGDPCLEILARVYRTKHAESHLQDGSRKPHPLYWSYNVWPIEGTLGRSPYCAGLVLQVTASTPIHHTMAGITEALLISVLQQEEEAEATNLLNAKLRAVIEDRERAGAEAEHLAFYDSLTSLPNRRLVIDRIHHALQICRRTMQHGAVLFIDLDGFKTVNDTGGHSAGDHLLQQVGWRLLSVVREADTVGRLGGDEFLVIIAELSEDPAKAEVQARKVGEKILESFRRSFQISEIDYLCTGSIGIALFGQVRESVEDLIGRADRAQYSAKAAGGGAIRVYDLEMEAFATKRQELETELKEGLQKEQFILLYQPQVDDKGRITGAEALLRWEHPHRGTLPPSEFIVAAEESGLIEPIGQWVMKAACRQLIAWSHAAETADLVLAINVSAREFSHPQFVTRLLTIVDEMGADTRKLILEFTERVMFGPLEATLEKMTVLKARGIRFSLDDFGIGYSSLAALRILPLDQLKLDGSFVHDVLTRPRDALIAIAILALARDL
ncbi:MAG: EAL domain-containing protein, partial [Saprospiraceae bacterium]